MRVERFYHSAPCAAENSAEFARASSSHANALAVFEQAFPQALEASAYALRKRLVCPRWWLIGVMAQWGSKDSDLLSGMLALNEGDFILSGSPLTAKTFPLLVSFWTEVFFQISNPNRPEVCAIEFESSRVVRGTSKEVAEQREFLTSYLSSALRIQRLKSVQQRSTGKRAKHSQQASTTFSLESLGLVQMIENVVLQEEGSGRVIVTFTRDPKQLFSLTPDELIPPSVSERGKKKGEPLPIESVLVTLQPDILQAMSRSHSPKKLLPYLSLELRKSLTEGDSDVRSGIESNVWRGRPLGAKELSNAHKEQIALARSFYDHGLLSWENEAPRLRVRQLSAQSAGVQSESGIVHCWRLSQHAIDAVQFEQALTSYLNNEQVINKPMIESSAFVQIPPAEPLLKSRSQSLNAVCAPRGAGAEGVSTASTQLSVSEPSETVPQRAPQMKPFLHHGFSRKLSAASTDVIQRSGAQRQIDVKPQARMKAEKPVNSSSSGESLPPIHSERTSSLLTSREQSSSGVNVVWNDDEYLMSVAEFYESLTPLQQQAFERERRRMSPEQFRQYVTPALKRHKLKNA